MLKKINLLLPNSIFGGSFALKCYDKLDRDVFDLDVIVEKKIFDSLEERLNDKDYDKYSDINEETSYENKRKKFVIDGISVDFFIDNNKKEPTEIPFDSTKILLNNYVDILDWKLSYLLNYNNKDFWKHYDDLNNEKNGFYFITKIAENEKFSITFNQLIAFIKNLKRP